MTTTEPSKRAKSALMWLLAGAVIGFAVSKYSVRAAYSAGYEEAQNKYALHYKHQVKMFAQHRDQSCMLYWFDDKPSKVAEARRWMCQYTDRQGRLK